MTITLPVMLMAMLAIGAIGQAQDRMPPIPADKMSPEQKKAVEEFRASRQAEVTGPFIGQVSIRGCLRGFAARKKN